LINAAGRVTLGNLLRVWARKPFFAKVFVRNLLVKKSWPHRQHLANKREKTAQFQSSILFWLLF
jgi:hypothetical protein